jgi:hypothetical protein
VEEEMLHRRFLFPVLPSLCLLVGACGDDPTGPEGIQGLFDLQYVGETLLPVLGAESGGCPLIIDHGSIALDTGGRFSAVIDAGIALCANGDSIRAATPDAGTYQIVGDSIEFRPDGTSPPYSGVFIGEGHFLELRHPRGTYTYFRYR